MECEHRARVRRTPGVLLEVLRDRAACDDRIPPVVEPDPLRKELGAEAVALAGDRVDAQLNDAVSRFVQNERNVKLRADGVHLSPLFAIHETDIRLALMVSTMLHSIATGNLLPATVRAVARELREREAAGESA